MRKYQFIYGTTDLAENLYYLLSQEKKKVDGFIVDKEYYFNTEKHGLPIIDYETFQDKYNASEVAIYLCIGYSGMNSYRKNKYLEMKAKGYKLKNYIHNSAIVESDIIGDGNIIFEQAYVGMYSKIGNGNIIYPKALIAHHTVVGDFNFFSISSSVAGDVVVGNENFFGNNSYTKDKIVIGDRNLIGAGAYLNDNVDNDVVIVPAKSVILKDKKSIDFL